MKKIILPLILIALFISFTGYSNLGFNANTPMRVVERNFECLKSGEWFLTFDLYDPNYFDQNKIFRDFFRYKFPSLDHIKLIELKHDGDKAYAYVELVFNNKKNITSKLILQEKNNAWKLISTDYSEKK